MSDRQDTAGRVYRIDQFIIPDTSREEWLTGVHRTHGFIKNCNGFRQDFLVERPAEEEGFFHAITIVEWESEAHFQQAIIDVRAMQAKNPETREQRWARLGIKPTLGDYRPILD